MSTTLSSSSSNSSLLPLSKGTSGPVTLLPTNTAASFAGALTAASNYVFDPSEYHSSKPQSLAQYGYSLDEIESAAAAGDDDYEEDYEFPRQYQMKQPSHTGPAVPSQVSSSTTPKVSSSTLSATDKGKEKVVPAAPGVSSSSSTLTKLHTRVVTAAESTPIRAPSKSYQLLAESLGSVMQGLSEVKTGNPTAESVSEALLMIVDMVAIFGSVALQLLAQQSERVASLEEVIREFIRIYNTDELLDESIQVGGLISTEHVGTHRCTAIAKNLRDLLKTGKMPVLQPVEKLLSDATANLNESTSQQQGGAAIRAQIDSEAMQIVSTMSERVTFAMARLKQRQTAVVPSEMSLKEVIKPSSSSGVTSPTLSSSQSSTSQAHPAKTSSIVSDPVEIIKAIKEKKMDSIPRTTRMLILPPMCGDEKLALLKVSDQKFIDWVLTNL